MTWSLQRSMWDNNKNSKISQTDAWNKSVVGAIILRLPDVLRVLKHAYIIAEGVSGFLL